jgi:hypothetical protein
MRNNTMDDKIYHLLNNLFTPDSNHTNIIDYEMVDRFEDDNSYIFTIPFNVSVSKDDITASAYSDGLIYNVLNETYKLLTLHPIVPELTQVTLHNNILDIVLTKNITSCTNTKVKIDVVIND